MHQAWAARPYNTDPSPIQRMSSFLSSSAMILRVAFVIGAVPQFFFCQVGAFWKIPKQLWVTGVEEVQVGAFPIRWGWWYCCDMLYQLEGNIQLGGSIQRIHFDVRPSPMHMFYCQCGYICLYMILWRATADGSLLSTLLVAMPENPIFWER